MLFVLMALITCAAIGYVLWPRRRQALAAGEETAPYTDGAMAIYMDQLAHLDEEVAEGRMMSREAEETKLEINRRLLLAGRSAKRAGKSDLSQSPLQDTRKLALILTAVAIPLVALTVYLSQGQPNTPGVTAEQQKAALSRAQEAAREEQALVAKLAEELKRNPDNPEGWVLLADAYVRQSQFGDAVVAYAEAIARKGPDAELLSSLGEALVYDADGAVTDEAVFAFQEALKMNSEDPRANYFIALSKAQAGDHATAVELWARLLEKTPAEAPYRPMIEAQIERSGRAMMASLGQDPAAGAKAPALPPEAVAQAEAMSDEDRAQMIAGMVQRLEDRLSDDPNDLQGWLRLGRSYVVLGETDKAIDVFDRAMATFKMDFAAIAELTQTRSELGLPPAAP